MEHAEGEEAREGVRDVGRGVEEGEAPGEFPAAVESSEVVDDEREERRFRHTWGLLIFGVHPKLHTTNSPKNHLNAIIPPQFFTDALNNVILPKQNINIGNILCGPILFPSIAIGGANST